MDVFEFRNKLVKDYRDFTRSFVQPKADDINAFLDSEYGGGRYWPSPLIQINPSYVTVGTVESLVAQGVLHPRTAEIFRFKKSEISPGVPAELFKHQRLAIDCCQRDEPYVVTTGTGSGKSLAYFIPMVDAILKAKEEDPTPRIRAIVIYPMNALANSQREELEKFHADFPSDGKPVTYARYTGQESQEERERIKQDPPDIILTNYMMLELLMTRQNERDKAVIRHADGLQFLVLDELHTYRGRQGADVAMLVRRVRERMNPNLVCIGTSATMATDGSREDRQAKVAEVASKLFGQKVSAGNIIGETLQRQIPGDMPSREALSKALCSPLTDGATFKELRQHPVAAWVELTLGIVWKDGWVRAKPKTLEEATDLLADDSGLEADHCKAYLARFLLLAYRARDINDKPLFAFRLHQFISGAGNLYATLEAPGKRHLDLHGQQFVPGDRSRRFYTVHFCRGCGQEYYPVWHEASAETGEMGFQPRDIKETAKGEEETTYGFLMLGHWNEEDYPENWLDFKKDPARLKPHYKKYRPQEVHVLPDGTQGLEGERGFYLPGGFRFCLACGQAHTAGRDWTRLGSLSAEGRSSATTTLTLSSLRYLLGAENELADEARKLLGFSDNRQDAALQAGHFNDFMQILLVRAGILASLNGGEGTELTDQDLAQHIFRSLGLDSSDPMVRADFLENPNVRAPHARRGAEEAMRNVLGYRAYHDLRRGWRYTVPNLEQVGLLKIEYGGLDELAELEEFWDKAPPMLAKADPGVRFRVTKLVLDVLRKNLCLHTRYLDHQEHEKFVNAAYTHLTEKWRPGDVRDMAKANYAITGPRPKHREFDLVSLGSRSRLAQELKKPGIWDNSPLFKQPNDKSWPELIDAILVALEGYGLILSEEIDQDLKGYQLVGEALVWKRGSGEPERDPLAPASSQNPYFTELYQAVAQSLTQQHQDWFQFMAHEHTAQVDPEDREERERDFRTGDLRVMFCSPTMELGVDISSLNTVYLRNVPPTPANYAQRSGRAGRSGQPALVITYCAAQSPHDQYFFREPRRMVHGQVTPPMLDLANEELVSSHLYATWLAETGVRLPSAINELIDVTKDNQPLMEDYSQELSREAVLKGAQRRGARLIRLLGDVLAPAQGVWLSKAEPLETAAARWAETKLNQAMGTFDLCFDRWRELYTSTLSQIDEASKLMMNPGSSKKEREVAKRRFDEGSVQLSLLQDNSKRQSDFETYRYLAGQGFLPGYNFPRLPLAAFIPGTRKGRSESHSRVLSRPRFLAISEFGPLSLIYHEGQQYRVKRVILGAVKQQQMNEARLPEQQVRLCPHCGYGHFNEQLDLDLCVACCTPLSEAKQVHNLFRIENVATRPVTRITCDEEERMRQGYDLRTTLQYPEENGQLKVVRSEMRQGDDLLAEMEYAQQAHLWRINLGWKRRKNTAIDGFMIDPINGNWIKDEEQEADDDDADQPVNQRQRISPYVEDRRNALVIRPKLEMSPTTAATLQYAIKRGIELNFQLEESELMAEPLPSPQERNALLFYEAAEGGAGVLTRLATDATAWKSVATTALELMHWQRPDDALPWHQQAVTQWHNVSNDCEAGCYRCILSYYNQPDHTLIDRQHGEALAWLAQLTDLTLDSGAGGHTPGDQSARLKRASGSSLEQAWLNALNSYRLRQPDAAQPYLEAYGVRPDFAYRDSRALIFVDGPHHDSAKRRMVDKRQTQDLEDAGFLVIRFPKETDRWPAIFARYPEVFGAMANTEQTTDEEQA